MLCIRHTHKGVRNSLRKFLQQLRFNRTDIVDLVKIIDASGLDYRLTAAGTIIEGRWDQLMDVARRCHTEMRQKTERVITFMKIDDYGDHAGRLTGAIASIEEKLRKPVKK